jgi:hypothetical protein
MTESTGFPPDLGAGPVPAAEAQAVAGAQLAAAAAQAPSGDAGQTVEQIRADAQREVLLPMENKINDLMAAFEKQSASQDAQIAALRAQLSAAQASVGPPPVVNLAQAVKDRLQTAADTSGIPREHWRPVLDQAGQLAAAAADAHQSGDGAKLPGLVAGIERWITRHHPRASGVHIEHFPAVLDDLDRLGEAAGHLAPAAG